MTMTAMAAELADLLKWNWGEAYLITGAAGRWIAHRRDNGLMLIASGPDELRELIIEDYAAQPVPHDCPPEAA
jgi:hypothetical protein